MQKMGKDKMGGAFSFFLRGLGARAKDNKEDCVRVGGR